MLVKLVYVMSGYVSLFQIISC